MANEMTINYGGDEVTFTGDETLRLFTLVVGAMNRDNGNRRYAESLRDAAEKFIELLMR